VSPPRPVPGRLALALACAALLAGAFSLVGCGRDRLRTSFLENQRPTVRLTRAPTPSSTPAFYAYLVEWTGFDPDGAVDHYVYCVDPPTAAGADTPWVATKLSHRTFEFPSGDPDSAGTMARPGGFHVFVVKAVDDRGAVSAPATDAFFSFTVAPSVQFLEPRRTSALINPAVPPTFTFVWTGTDPDGIHGRFPTLFKYKLFPRSNSDYDYNKLRLQPDSLRAHYAPAFAGWDSVASDTCHLTIEGMTPGSEAVLAVVAFDEAGAYSPVFSYDGNLLCFSCSYSGAGPVLSVWNDYFSYTYGTASYSLDPGTFLHLEVPGGSPVGFYWSAKPHAGSEILAFRWAMDLETIDDPTPRSDENTDWRHWSRASALLTQATVGPFVGTGADSLEQHVMYIEAEDTNHLKSLSVIVLRVMRITGERALLFVDDTRLPPDRGTARADSVTGPAGNWPTAAELDTFLFAVGGVHWRSYVPPVNSTPGIFAGYDFDTLGTRGLRAVPIPLSVLSRYRSIVWYADPAQEYLSSFDSPRYPMTLIRSMSATGRFNPLIAFGEMGGGVWMMGGGIAFNALLPWNKTSNDLKPIYPYTGRGGMVFSQAAGELVAGRMMYQDAHWRSEISMKSPGRAQLNAGLAAYGGAPDWSLLPARLLEKTAQTDPQPPMRTIPSQFYITQYPGEALTQPNVIAGLDTLYFATNGDLATGVFLPVMTLYHGTDCGPTVFSGFPLWYFQRAQAIQLGDFVLQRVWHLTRRAVAR
jgi:hypothetical protein